MPTPARRLFASLSPGSERNLLDTLREERVGGALLLAGTVVALLWANVDPSSYAAVSDTVVGPAWLRRTAILEHPVRYHAPVPMPPAPPGRPLPYLLEPGE